MYEFLRGKLVHKTPVKAVLEVGGIGFAVQISIKTYQKLPSTHTDLLMYVAPILREDGQTLYGFLTLEEKELFHQLIAINGVGPKTAVTILGHVEIVDFQLAVLQKNSLLLSKIPGIGKKTSERLIMELKDKFEGHRYIQSQASTPGSQTIAQDAISAMIHLGYPPLEAQKKIRKIVENQDKELSLSEVITAALRS